MRYLNHKFEGKNSFMSIKLDHSLIRARHLTGLNRASSKESWKNWALIEIGLSYYAMYVLDYIFSHHQW